jgi:integrase
LADATSRGVAPATQTKLTTIFRKQFLSWTRSQGLAYLDEIDLDALLNFRSTWSDAALAKQKKQSQLIGFFWACVRRRYLQENPALGLGKIKVVQIPTDYFPPEEFDRIIDTTYRVCDNRGGFIDTDSNRTRLRTMTLLMRWSGLRIRDAITLERHRIHGDSLLLYQAKTGTPVYVPLLPSWSRLSRICRPARNPISAISSGAAMVIPKARSPIGREAIGACSSWLISGRRTARSSAATRTCSATPSLSRCCLRAYPSIRSRSCLATLL